MSTLRAPRPARLIARNFFRHIPLALLLSLPLRQHLREPCDLVLFTLVRIAVTGRGGSVLLLNDRKAAGRRPIRFRGSGRRGLLGCLVAEIIHVEFVRAVELVEPLNDLCANVRADFQHELIADSLPILVVVHVDDLEAGTGCEECRLAAGRNVETCLSRKTSGFHLRIA